MKDLTKKALSLGILLILVALIVYYISSHFSEFKELRFVNPIYIIPLFLIIFILSIVNGVIHKYLLQPFGIDLRFKEWFGLSIITSFYNIITPLRGGAIARAIYLKRKYHFTYTNFISTLSGIYVITVLAASFLGLVSMVLIYYEYNMFNLLIFLIFLFFFIPTAFVTLFSPKFKETKYNLINKFIAVLNGWHTIRSKRKIVLASILVSLAQLTLSTISVILIYNVFGIDISFSQALFLSTVGAIGSLISITPGSLGISEAIAVFSALVIGITPAQSLSAAILSRILQAIFIFILGPIYSYILIRKINTKDEKNLITA